MHSTRRTRAGALLAVASLLAGTGCLAELAIVPRRWAC